MSDPRFSGISRLYGSAALERFSQAKVAVVGIGGVGSWAVEALARSGIGHLTLIDLDEICLTNVNRQLHAMNGQIGKLKTSAMHERILAINPAATVIEQQTFYSEKNSDILLGQHYDLIIDAIDALHQKCHLIAECKKRALPLITCGAAGGRSDPTRILVDDLAHTLHDPLLAAARKNLRTHYDFPRARSDKRKAKKFHITAVYSTELPVYPHCDGSVSEHKPADSSLRLNCASGYGTATPVTATFGMVAAAEALKFLSLTPV